MNLKSLFKIPVLAVESVKPNSIKRIGLILLLLSLTIGLDQYSKVFVRHHLEYYNEYTYLHRRIIFERVDNTGAFLSLGDSLNGSVKTVLLNLIPLAILIFGLVYILIKTNLERINLIAVILILGGGFGNLYDRVMHGSVTDFMQIKLGFLHTGIFNVADMLIMAGMIIILIRAFLNKKEANGENLDKSLESENS